MDYNVIISDRAESQLDQFIYYILVVLGSEQAARNVLEDAEETKVKLSHIGNNVYVEGIYHELQNYESYIN